MAETVSQFHRLNELTLDFKATTTHGDRNLYL
jgi:hypothetical protein